jgi:hypothetical protein
MEFVGSETWVEREISGRGSETWTQRHREREREREGGGERLEVELTYDT